MKASKSTLILILVLTLFIGSNGYTFRAKWWLNPRVISFLNLSDDQIQQIEDVFSSYLTKIIKLDSQVKQVEIKITEALRSKNIDDAKIEKLVKKAAEIRKQLYVARLKMRIDIIKKLTTKQRLKFLSVVQGLMMHRRGPHARNMRRRY